MGLQVFLHHEVQGGLGQVLGDATPTVSIWDLCVLQVHDPFAHIFIEQDSPVMTSSHKCIHPIKISAVAKSGLRCPQRVQLGGVGYREFKVPYSTIFSRP